jgi:hypothetical protein
MQKEIARYNWQGSTHDFKLLITDRVRDALINALRAQPVWQEMNS